MEKNGGGRHAMKLGIKYLMTTDATQKTTKKVESRSKGPIFLFFFGFPVPPPPGIDIYAVRGKVPLVSPAMTRK